MSCVRVSMREHELCGCYCMCGSVQVVCLCLRESEHCVCVYLWEAYNINLFAQAVRQIIGLVRDFKNDSCLAFYVS